MGGIHWRTALPVVRSPGGSIATGRKSSGPIGPRPNPALHRTPAVCPRSCCRRVQLPHIGIAAGPVSLNVRRHRLLSVKNGDRMGPSRALLTPLAFAITLGVSLADPGSHEPAPAP